MVAALKQPGLRAQLREAGTTPAPSSPVEFETYLREEIACWRDKGLKVE